MKTRTTTTTLEPEPEPDTNIPRPANSEPRLVTTAQLVLVMLLWALCYPLINIGLKLVPPFQFAAIRAALAGLGLLLVARLLGRPMPRGRSVWLGIVVAGGGATSLGFYGMFFAGGLVAPGLATVIANTQPLIAGVLAYLFLRERLRPIQIGGVLLGFGGIILIAATALGASAGAGVSLNGVAYVLAGALGVAIGNVAIKRIAPEVDALMAMGWQLLIGAVPLALAAAVLEHPAPGLLNLRFIAVVLTLAWAGTSVVFALWCHVLQKIDLSRANAFSFLSPTFAVIIGMVGFHERIGWSEAGGGLLVLTGLYLANRSP